MEISTDKCIQKLEELIIDEDKIVTVPFLCTTLNISAAESKLALQKFVTINRKTHPGSLSLTYILSGLRDSNTPLISIVKEENLDDKKDVYAEEPIAEIYSVQKCKELDFNSISLIDHFNVCNPREKFIKGSIVSKNCIKRHLNFTPVPQTTIKTEPSLTKNSSKALSSTANGVKQSIKSSNHKTGSTSKGANVVELFKSVQPKSKANNKSAKADVQKEVQSASQKLSDSNDEDSEKPILEVPSKNSVVKQKKIKKDTSLKRRKRIIVKEESDDDIFASEGEEEEVIRKRKNVLEDSEEDEPIKKSESTPAPKNKKRKLVDKTFEDEEGYIITRKEWVDLSGSENESQIDDACERKVEDSKKETNKHEKKADDVNLNIKEKVANNKGNAAKGKKAVPTNQPTLMNFFKMK